MALTRALSTLEWRLSRHFAVCATVAAASPFLAANAAEAAVRHRVYNLPIAADVHGLYLNVETGVAASTAGEALERNFSLWPIETINLYGYCYTVYSWAEEDTRVRAWIHERLVWMDENVAAW